MEEFEKTFDNIAEEYDSSRPMYVAELFKDLFAYSSINSESHVLEIGMGTGKASEAILDFGCHLVGLEPENLGNRQKQSKNQEEEREQGPVCRMARVLKAVFPEGYYGDQRIFKI